MEEMLFTQSELFELLTSQPRWYEGYCDANNARQLRYAHRLGSLGQKTYDDIFFHFGYIKLTKWIKPNNL